MSTEEQKSDPVLEQAIAEIQEVLKKHDVGGHVVLVSKTHGEYLYHLSPSWSCVKIEPSENAEAPSIRFKSKAADYGSEEKRNEVIQQSAALLFTLRDLTGRAFMIFEQMTVVLNDKIGPIQHEPFKNHWSKVERQ